MSDEAEDKIQQLEEKRELLKNERAKLEKAQYAVDLEARIELEEEYESIAGVKVVKFVRGQPTHAFVRSPKPGEYKRYKDLVFRTQQKQDSKGTKEAQEQLATSCWVYPKTKEEREKMLEEFPGILTPIALAAINLAEGRAEEEGKG